MYIFLGFAAVSIAIMLVFSDKIIGHYYPNGDLAKIENDVDEVILS